MILRNLTLSAFLTSILVISKYCLGFIQGVEIVTFLCILYGVLLPIKVWIQIIPTFIIITGLIYGFGTWWVVYWFIFPTETFISWLFKKWLLKFNLIFALWCGFWGFSIALWYFPYDWILFGYSKAIASLSLAIIPNLLGAVSNFVISLILMEPCHKFFKKHFKFNDKIYWSFWV